MLNHPSSVSSSSNPVTPPVTTTSKGSKGRCAFHPTHPGCCCLEKVVKIVGYCRYCSLDYCSRHRLPEAHACPNLQHCKDKASSFLAEKLLAEKTVGQKV